MPRATHVPDPVVFPTWDGDLDTGEIGLTRHGEAVMAYIDKFGATDGNFYGASKPATIVSFEHFLHADLYSSGANNAIKVRFDGNVNEVVSVNAKYVWPRKAVASTSRHNGGVGGSAGAAAGAAEKSGLAELQLQYKTAQAHIKALATENKNLAQQNKELGESAQFLLQRNTETSAELEHEKAMKLKIVKRSMDLETDAANAQDQQQIAQDELQTTKQQLRDVKKELNTLRGNR